MIIKTEYTLKQITPMYHFKYGEIENENNNNKELVRRQAQQHKLSTEVNEGLRATEVKPRFITHLKNNSSIEINKGNISKYQHNIKIMINQSEHVMVKEQYNKGVPGFSNKHLPTNSEDAEKIKNNFIKFKHTTLTMKINQKDGNTDGISAEEVVIIRNELIKFINTYNFGRRSGKGFGSFVVTGNSANLDCYQTVDFEGKVVTYEKNYTHFSKVENFAGNIKKRSRIKSFVDSDFYVTKDKKDNISLIKLLMGSTKNGPSIPYHLRYDKYMFKPEIQRITAPYWIKPVSANLLVIYYNRLQLEKNVQLVQSKVNTRYGGRHSINKIPAVMEEIFPLVIADASFEDENKRKGKPRNGYSNKKSWHKNKQGKNNQNYSNKKKH